MTKVGKVVGTSVTALGTGARRDARKDGMGARRGARRDGKMGSSAGFTWSSRSTFSLARC